MIVTCRSKVLDRDCLLWLTQLFLVQILKCSLWNVFLEIEANLEGLSECPLLNNSSIECIIVQLCMGIGLFVY
jgi:hypothetical protein